MFKTVRQAVNINYL